MNWFHRASSAAHFAGIPAVLAKAGSKEAEPNLATAIRTTVVLPLSWVIVLAGGKPDWGGVIPGYRDLLLSPGTVTPVRPASQWPATGRHHCNPE